jgi:hypothetical protein
MNDGSIKEENFDWTDTVSANINNFVDAINKEDEYIFKDIEKFQNIAVLEAINESSVSKKSIDVETFN